MPLTDTKIAKTVVASKDVKLRDERGMYLLMKPGGGRWWRMDYRFAGKRKTISLGVYPEVTLREARTARDMARRTLRDGRDPSAVRSAQRRDAGRVEAEGVTFGAVMAEWQAQRAKTIAAATRVKQDGILTRYLTSSLGPVPVHAVSPRLVLDILRPISSSNRHETATAVKRIVSQVLRYAVATGRAERDCTPDIRGALPPVKARHFSALTTPAHVGALLRAIHADNGSSPIVSAALRLTPIVFVRPGELRAMEWTEIDFDAGLWRIPAERMKARKPHLVPLARQAVALLRNMQSLTGDGRFVFPNLRDRHEPMSANAVRAALHRLGYSSDEQTAHGFRTTASTLLNERGEDRDVIELQLAHGDQDTTRAAYNRAQRLPDRIAMMQRYADYLDELRAMHRQ